VKPARSRRAGLAQLAAALPSLSRSQAWLVLAVYEGRLPLEHEVEAAVRTARHEGTDALLRTLTAQRRRPSRWFAPRVAVIADAVLVDVHDTASTVLVTGVQRVARNLATHWVDRGIQLVGWSVDRTQLRPVSTDVFRSGRRRRVFGRNPIVPWGGHYLLIETLNEPARSGRIQALAACAGVTSGFIAHDAIPLDMAEVTGERMPGVFAKYLAAVSRFDRAVTDSEASAAEYRGWRRMLAAAGITGPDLHTVPLPVEAGAAPPHAEAAARSALLPAGASDLPLVLCVGSHEPRKNHESVVHAAEVLWREGRRFALAFLGGNAWGSEPFRGAVERLQSAGRPVTIISRGGDELLWWAYRLARFTVFPSLAEGYGLPVAESLAAGTPVITSGYGSMAEIAESGGCLLVDPRDDRSIVDAMRALLLDDDLLGGLADEAHRRPTRTWADYAEDVWRVLAP
jgi:glycosyltransferase involved in cell wall biosynthesis